MYFSSRRFQISGSVDDCPVSEIILNTAADVSVVSRARFMSHPTLRAITIQPVPPAAVALRAANGPSLNILGFVFFSLTLGAITHDVAALVVPSLGPDSLLLDNKVMPTFGAVLDWQNKTVSFLSAGGSIPAIHRTSYPASRRANPSPVSCNHTMSVVVVHHDAEGANASLRERVDVKPGHETLVVAFTDCLPSCGCAFVIEPRIMSELDFLPANSSSVFEKNIVARTLATWYAADGSVAVQVANPPSYGVALIALRIGLCLGQLLNVSIVTPDQLHVNATAKTPESADELAQAKSERRS